MVADDTARLGEKALPRMIETVRNVCRHPLLPHEDIKAEDLLLPIIPTKAATYNSLSERDRSRTKPTTEINNCAFSSNVASRALLKESDFDGRDHSGNICLQNTILHEHRPVRNRTENSFRA